MVIANYTPSVAIHGGSSTAGGSWGWLSIAPANNTAQPQRVTVILASEEPFTVGVFRGKEELATYRCPGGVALALSMALEHRASPTVHGPGMGVISIAWAPSWQLAVYAVIGPLFAAAAIMDVRDFKARRGRARVEAAAIAIRYAMYASMVGAAAIALGSLAHLAYSYITRGALEVDVVALLLSLLLLGLTSTMYGVARWRGWYDAVDELE